MPVLVMSVFRRRGKIWFRKAAHCNRDVVWLALRLPEDGRSAGLTKIEIYVEASVRLANKSSSTSLEHDSVATKERGQAECAARPPLALQTAAQRNELGFAATADG